MFPDRAASSLNPISPCQTFPNKSGEYHRPPSMKAAAALATTRKPIDIHPYLPVPNGMPAQTSTSPRPAQPAHGDVRAALFRAAPHFRTILSRIAGGSGLRFRRRPEAGKTREPSQPPRISCAPKTRAPSAFRTIAPPISAFRKSISIFALDPQATRVTAKSQVERAGAADAPLVLNGEHMKLLSVAIDGKTLAADEVAVDAETLTIAKVPDRFTLEIVTEIAPAQNTALEGLYLAKGIFCTQCEAEGFRRITYFLDRPDNLSVYTTRIEAPKEGAAGAAVQRQPRSRPANCRDGRHFAVWHDPFPKPSYLFALVAGDLGVHPGPLRHHERTATSTCASMSSTATSRARLRHGFAQAGDEMGRRELTAANTIWTSS